MKKTIYNNKIIKKKLLLANFSVVTFFYNYVGYLNFKMTQSKKKNIFFFCKMWLQGKINSIG